MNGRAPTETNSRKRVVRPMLKNAKVNAQVRNACSGATSPGNDVLFVPRSRSRSRKQVTRREAARNPSTNFGNRARSRAPLARLSTPVRSQRVAARSDEHEGPDADPYVAADDLHEREGGDRGIGMSRDAGDVPGVAAVGLRGRKTRGIRKLRCADPGAGDPGGRPSARAASGSTKIMTMAQATTSEIATEMSCFFAPTAPPMAMAPETPHTAPPVPKVAASRRSRSEPHGATHR